MQSTNTPPCSGCQERQHFARHDRLVNRHRPVRAQIRQRARVFVGERLALHLGDEPLVVPHVQIIHLAKHVDFADHRGGLTQPRRNDDAALAVDFGDLAEEVHAVQELQPGWMRRGNLRELSLDVGPHRHGVDPDRVTVHDW